MRWFYDRYSPLFENLRQLAVEFDSDAANLTKASSNEPNLRQFAVELFSIPWGHHQIIIGKCPSLEESIFYVHETAANGWSRAVLSNFIKNGLFSRQGKAVTNFAGVLPEGASDLAQQLTKDPYDFNFLTLDKKYKEKNLKDALIDNIESFLLELGSGFAFLGREVRLEVGEKEKFMDMLFYNLRLRCYVVVEVKVEDLDSENLGQIGLYVSEVNRQLKKEGDNPTIGLLVVAKKDELFAKYALNMMSVPIGIAEYKLTNLLPEELSRSLPGVKGLSPQNLRYAEKFFVLYSDDIKNFPQAVGELFSIPWGHHRTIIDKCKSFDEAFFYVRKTLNDNWSRSTLENHLASGLYQKKGAALTNFASLSPLPNGPLAQEITKDPYDFDFLAIRPEYDEKELKDALVSDIQRFLLELGSGFAFVGRETRMLVGESELYDDLLFYHTKLHCYVVVEVKTRKFQPSDLGQLSGYVAAVNHQQKTEGDGPTIGLLICKGKDEVLVKYCLENYSVPLGVSEYDLTHFIESEFKGSMPTIEEIEAGVKGNGKK